MPAILAAVMRVLAYAQQILGILGTISGIVRSTAEESSPLHVETTTDNTQLIVSDASIGNAALRTLALAIDGREATDLPAILSLLGDLTPVTLPSSPPSGYGAPSIGDWAASMWPVAHFRDFDRNTTYDQLLYQISMLGATMFYGQGLIDPTCPDFALCADDPGQGYESMYPYVGRGSGYWAPVNIDWTTWNGTDTLVEFLAAATPGHTWSYTDENGNPTPGHACSPLDVYLNIRWRCLVKESDLPLRSGRLWDAIKGPSGLPPVWPGLDGVTLGTPSVLTDSGIVVGLMHGITVSIDARKPGAGHFGVDGQDYGWRAGYVAFLTDTGAAEEPQYLGWSSAVYLPKHMTVAAGVLVVLVNTTQLTATPFTIG